MSSPASQRLGVVLLLSAVTTLGLALGAYWLSRVDAADRDRQAQAMQTLVTSGLELGKGNAKNLQTLLSSLPSTPPFSRLEIGNKSGKLLEVQFEGPSQSWLDRFLPEARPVELPLQTKGGLVLKLVPSSAPLSRRLADAATLVLPVVIAVFLGIPLVTRRMESGGAMGKIDDQRWASVLAAPQRTHEEPVRTAPPVPVAQTLAVDRLPVAILRCDQHGHISYMNAAARTLFGQTVLDGIGQPFLELIAPWERHRMADVLAGDFSSAVPSTVKTQALVARGGVLPVIIDLAAVPDGAGEIVLCIRDAGELWTMQETLNARTRLLDCLNHGVAVVSAHDGGEILYCNQTFRELLQYPERDDRPDLLLQRIAAISDSAATQLRAAIVATSPVSLRISWQGDDGRTRALDMQVAPASLNGADSANMLVCNIHDRTEENAFRLGVEEDLTRQRRILDEMPLGLCIADEQGRVREVNPQLARLTGRSREQMIDAAMEDWLVRDSRKSSPMLQGEYGVRCESGDRMAKVNTLKLTSAAGEPVYAYFFEDITLVRQKAQQVDAELALLRQILDEIAVGIITTNADGFIQYFNPHAQRLTGLTEHQYKGMALGQIVHLVDDKKREPLADPAMRAMRIGKTVRFRQDVLLLSENKQELAVEVSATPVRDRRNAVSGCVVVMLDVSEQRSITHQMNLRASRDPLTGLANRRELLSLLETLQYESDEQGKQHSLCYMDLDRFKIINDTCGHNAGDELLRQVSELMNKCLRANDILARIGGDEFCAVLRNTAPSSAAIVAEKIREAIKHFRFAWGGKYFDIGVSVGISGLIPGSTVEDTINAADEACYVAKEKGRDLVWVASAPEESGKPASAPWNERLSVAMEHDYFRLYRQDALYLQPEPGPNYHEVLLRLHEPGRAPLAASGFMPSAQRFNLAPAIERWIIGKLLSSIAAPGVRTEVLSDVYGIQLSVTTLSESSFLTFLLEQSQLYRIHPRRICFEIGEDDLVQNFSLVQKFMRECTEYGFRFCLNQFGGGISSFAYIRNLPLGFLKIDPSLTRDAGTDPIDESIVRAIHDISESMNILTMTQQVNNTTVLENLRAWGVHYAQGPAIQDPMPLEIAAEANRPRR